MSTEAVAAKEPASTPVSVPASASASAPAPAPAPAPDIDQKKNRIQVSNTKKPLFFYVNLTKRYIQKHNEVELSALGMAITNVVTIAEILKKTGFATEKKVLTSTVGMRDESKGRIVQKARIEIILGKADKFDSQMNGNKGAGKGNNDTQKDSKQ